MCKREAQPVFNLPTRKNKKRLGVNSEALLSSVLSLPFIPFSLEVSMWNKLLTAALLCLRVLCAPPQRDASVQRLIRRVILSPPCLMSHCKTSPTTILFSFIWLLTTPFLLLSLSPLPLPSTRCLCLISCHHPCLYSNPTSRPYDGVLPESLERGAFMTLIVSPLPPTCSWAKTVQPPKDATPRTGLRLFVDFPSRHTEKWELRKCFSSTGWVCKRSEQRKMWQVKVTEG